MCYYSDESVYTYVPRPIFLIIGAGRGEEGRVGGGREAGRWEGVFENARHGCTAFVIFMSQEYHMGISLPACVHSQPL